jgi:hypothetical protein
MFALCGNRTRDLLRSRQVYSPIRQIGRQINKYSTLHAVSGIGEKNNTPPFLAYIHTYHSRFIPKGVAEVSQIFLRDANVLPKLFNIE